MQEGTKLFCVELLPYSLLVEGREDVVSEDAASRGGGESGAG